MKKPTVMLSAGNGKLHAHLGIPQGARIPLSTLMQARRLPNPSTRKPAVLSANLRKGV